LLFLVVAGNAAAQSVDSSAVTRSQPQLHTPDEIAPAVLPYLACLYASRGLPLLRGSDGRQIGYDKNDADCSAARKQAQADALKLLDHKSIPGGASAAAFIDDALSQMDSYVASLPVRSAAAPGGQSVLGLPVTIEDEVQPAYNRYVGCLKDQVGDTPVSVDTILTVFQQAMTVCRTVRDSAVIEAEAALVKKGWDATARAAAANNTFAKADESWLAMGRQFRESLIAKGSARPPEKRGEKPH
jgi:hypothetical protein